MAKQKNDVKRKRWSLLDSLLSQAKPLSQEQIFDAYKQTGIKPSVPTLRKDLDIFKKALIATERQGMLVEGRGGMKKLLTDGNDNRTRTYCYMEKGFSVLPFLKTELTDGEYRSLISAINKLRGILQNDKTFEEIRFAIQSRVEADYQKAPFVDYEDNRRLKGREYRPLFYKAIVERQVLHIHYRTFLGIELEYDFHPYLLKQFNERWFVFGLGVDTGNVYTSIPLDRLEEAPVAVGSFPEECPEDYMTYFNQRVGVSNNLREQRVRHIVLSVHDRETWGRIVTKPIHRSQEVVSVFSQNEQAGVISLDVVPNLELLARFLSLGDSVIIEDTEDAKDFRELYISTIKKISGHYPEI